jgi:hypothetical protein
MARTYLGLKPQERSEEAKILAHVMKEKGEDLKVGDEFFLVWAKWWDLWKDFSGYEGKGMGLFCPPLASFGPLRLLWPPSASLVLLRPPLTCLASLGPPLASFGLLRPPSDAPPHSLPANKDAPSPDTIDNDPLLEKDSKYKIKGGLLEFQDYVMLPRGAWKTLFSWYGGGPEIRRFAVAVSKVWTRVFLFGNFRFEMGRVLLQIFKGSYLFF